jgi:hypothetical protein
MAIIDTDGDAGAGAEIPENKLKVIGEAAGGEDLRCAPRKEERDPDSGVWNSHAIGTAQNRTRDRSRETRLAT